MELATHEAERARLVQEWNDALGAAPYRFDKIVQMAEAGIHGHTVAEPRRDMHPKLAALLGMDVLRPPTRDEIANLAERAARGRRGHPGRADATGNGRARRRAWPGPEMGADLGRSEPNPRRPTRGRQAGGMSRDRDGKIVLANINAVLERSFPNR
jgi:hypothetical protein